MSEFGKTIQLAAQKLNQDIDISVIEQLLALVQLGIIKIYSSSPRMDFNIDNTRATLNSMVAVRFEGKERIIDLENELQKTMKAFKKAKAYIDETPCDPDIYPEQMKAWREYQEALKQVREAIK